MNGEWRTISVVQTDARGLTNPEQVAHAVVRRAGFELAGKL